VVVVGAVIDTLILAGRPGGPGRSLGSTTLGQGFDLLTAQGSSALARGGQIALADELGHVAEVAAEDCGCLLVREPVRRGEWSPRSVTGNERPEGDRADVKQPPRG
jgi:hypothetical protein